MPRKKYSKQNGKLIDHGPMGRGRPANGYEIVQDDLIIQGVSLRGHFFCDLDPTEAEAQAIENAAKQYNYDDEVFTVERILDDAIEHLEQAEQLAKTEYERALAKGILSLAEYLRS